MQAIEPLEYGYTYHIYNRGIHGADLFTCEADCIRFLSLYDRYITPVADTYTWVLLRNHFHYFKKRNARHGGLFETPFRRIRVNTEKYFHQIVFDIHHNPVKHGFVEHISDWVWSSYQTIISEKPTRLRRETVLEYFDDAANFEAWHQREHDLKDVGNLLLEV